MKEQHFKSKSNLEGYHCVLCDCRFSNANDASRLAASLLHELSNLLVELFMSVLTIEIKTAWSKMDLRLKGGVTVAVRLVYHFYVSTTKDLRKSSGR